MTFHLPPAFPKPPEPPLVVPPPGLIGADGESVTGERADRLSDIAARMEVAHRLGLSTDPDPVLDEIAADLAARMDMQYAFVNLITDQQHFIGLRQPPDGHGYVPVGRTMSLDRGWCRHTITRDKALPLPDIYASRFHLDFVAEALGVRTYFGMSIKDPVTGTPFATVCAIDREVRTVADSYRLRDITVDAAEEARDVIVQRAR
ncbi:GAF domain-containing protein [Streptomyces acidiscabies]|uniref:GAF domain-containing protein n=1 Tax=Streptomyces acidiscabies TaxID=42234 RepID=A0AAP6BKC1_9ACTN|nr:GAF domain-containing protein [Streptomyces acidiscabies]MBP5936751.1 GAF domain-containing protein [Streptomyces sp. LBUM 1476]MBZ3915242.1 GAF domain-containing protein [Streptomyces acidiscabies]MDX2966067.1 GAF domain-containing protein [Streptomyces acidiscabies]MDX3021304.1 GAF domain-containing protein [Streptomyces acidiscabies]MDX3793443.1 GAF domain-containing protein [Streptomyces acidiscabies]